MNEEDILAAADLIRTRRALVYKIENAPKGTDFMIRWTTPGISSYTSIPIKYKDVEGLITQHFAPLLLKVDDDLAERYKGIMKREE